MILIALRCAKLAETIVARRGSILERLSVRWLGDPGDPPVARLMPANDAEGVGWALDECAGDRARQKPVGLVVAADQ